MRRSSTLLPLLDSLCSFSDAKPLEQSSVSFHLTSAGQPGSAQNVVIEYGGHVDGELQLHMGQCDSEAVVSAAKQ